MIPERDERVVGKLTHRLVVFDEQDCFRSADNIHFLCKIRTCIAAAFGGRPEYAEGCSELRLAVHIDTAVILLNDTINCR